MRSEATVKLKARGSWIPIQLLAFVLLLGALFAQQAAAQAVCPNPNNVGITLPNIGSQSNSDNYCELCGTGWITARVYYYGNSNNNDPITNIVIRQDLSGPGLQPIPGTTTVTVSAGPAPPAPTPTLIGGQWTWNFGSYQLQSSGSNPGNAAFIQIRYQVRRTNSVTEEGLFGASKAIASSVSYSVGGPTCETDAANNTLPFRRPEVNVIKDGRNADAGQTGWSDPVYGHNNDDIIWRIRVQNNGLADLQDLRLDDFMQGGNLVINYACPTAAAAATIANQNGGGPIPAGCISAGNTVDDFIVANPFGYTGGNTNFPNGGATNGFTRNLNGRDIDVRAGTTQDVLYLVGKITANGSCISGGRTNTVSDVQFGCEADGGSVGGLTASGDAAVLRTYHGDVNGQLTITRSFTGVNTVGTTTVSTQPVGARGLVTLTIQNNTGGTVKDIVLNDVLPPQYVIDPTYWSGAGGTTKTLPVRTTGGNAPIVGESSITPAYGNAYQGMINRLTWENPQGSLTAPSQNPMQNTAPRFRLWSTAAHPNYPAQIHMLRQGDVVRVTFPIVLISQNRNAVEPYDLVADLDETPEAPATSTDPDPTRLLTNLLTADYNTFCTTQGNNGAGHFTFNYNNNNNINAFPEDLDVAITDINNNPGAVFILTNDPNQPLPLRVRLTNNGGHSATGYRTFVTFGATMQVVTSPGSCSIVTPSGTPLQPNPWKVWVQPAPIPAQSTVYQCTGPAVTPNQTVNLDFAVIKTSDAARIALDDLSFRADVVGEIPLHDGTPLWFPTPITRPDGQLDRANNYSLDGVRQKVIGFNLIKTIQACNENEPATSEPGPNTKPAQRVEIGEECAYRVQSGGWFGFETPGFLYIAVEDVELTDNLPTGQGYVSSTDPYPTSTAQIQGISLMGSNVPPTPNGLFAPGAPFSWRFNQTQRITQLDEWFEASVTTRVLNHPIDTRAAPNVHAANSQNVLVSDFTAVFADENSVEQLHRLSPSTVGYPNPPIRTEDLKITEPMLEVVKEVCNETIYGVGLACTNWTTQASGGDALHDYIYRITVRNRAADNGIARSPAYDVIVTDTLDTSGLACVMDFDTDGLDNDADGADGGDEGTVTNGNPTVDCPSGRNGVVTFSHTHSTGLQRINPGQSVQLYYRVDFDDDATPQQVFRNTAVATYDSLAGSTNEFGNQTIDQRPNGDIGGARVYASAPAEARVILIPVEVDPKRITRTSNPPSTPVAGTQPVVVGEEIEYQLTTLLPVATLFNFVIRDELPNGLRCVEAPVLDLGPSGPYSAAGFRDASNNPPAPVTPTCSDDFVEWNFGAQLTVTNGTVGNRYPFSIRFIARVENSTITNNGVVLSNGDPATNATARYFDAEVGGNLIEIAFGQVDVVVREPVLELTNSFAPAVDADAGDHLPVTVTVANTGTANAYNVRLLDNLNGLNLTFVPGSVGSTGPPPSVDTSSPDGNKYPIFSWAANDPIAPGETRTFTFRVSVDDTAQPHEILENTIQASWTSLPSRDTVLSYPDSAPRQIGPDGDLTGMRNGALPNAGDTLNDYEAEASADITMRTPVFNKTDQNPALAPAIGAHKRFLLEIALPEGTTRDVAITDNLNAGSESYVLTRDANFNVVYELVGIATINGQPVVNGQTQNDSVLNAVPADGASGTVTWNIGTVVTQSEDDLAAQALAPAIRIYYYARINNDLATDAGDTLQNTAVLTYINGATDAPMTLSDATAAITVIEPTLVATKRLTNVTPGKNALDPLELNDIAEYVVTVVNGSNATAHDINIVDTPPIELELYSGFTPTATIDAQAVTGFVATPANAPRGPLVWGRGNGDASLDLPPNSFLELTYRMLVSAEPIAGGTIDNNVWVDWTSLDDASPYERTGMGCPNFTQPDDYCYGPALAEGIPSPVGPPDTLKANTQPTAGIGEPFSYRITIPAVPYAAPLYDVRITDNLAASNAVLEFVSVTKVSGPGDWTPVNTGMGTNLVIEDPVNGIDIPAGQQAVIEITVRLANVPQNVAGLTFTNTAVYTYNRLNGNVASMAAGEPGTTEPMTIVEPELTLTKGGPPQMRIGQAGTFTLNVHNISQARAYGVTLTDRVPNTSNVTAAGGMCAAQPAGFTAQLYQADGTTAVGAPLVEGTDFSIAFVPAADSDAYCTVTVTMLTTAAVIGPDQRLIVTYQAWLDTDTEQDAELTNVAGATQWYSAQPNAPDTDPRNYTRALTDGTVGTLDHEDAHTVLANFPVLRFEKIVANVSRGTDPAAVATPGERLRYRLRIENLSDVPVADFRLHDELDALNNPDQPAFAPGTLSLITVPAGADVTNTNATGGARGTGVLDIRSLNLGGQGSVVEVVFEVTLAPVIANGSFVYNQVTLFTGGFPLAVSDDPNVNGQDDPMVSGDEDPTRILIESAPRFRIEKISTYLTGDPNVLLAGETLRYTITVRNIGTDHATGTMLRDAIPANTTYVAGSTTLNGAAIPDAQNGLAPLVDGILIYAAEDPTPGAMRADATAGATNVATLTFDVVVYPDVLDGTVIANQAFVSAPGGGIIDQPSDDPRTPIVNDPTRDVVGNSPLLYAEKSAALEYDAGSPGIVDPGDVLRYTIRIYNNGPLPATQAMLRDAVPEHTTYVADSLTLNGLPVAQPDGGVSPLVAGINVSSSDLTPPLPGAGEGVLTRGQVATIQFDLRVNDGTAPGTLIVNQAVVASAELPNLLTDGDGNPATGPEPTIVVVGDLQQLRITKQVAVVGGGAAVAGATLEYLVSVTNFSAVPAQYVVITDDLSMPFPGYLTYVDQSATLNGAATGISVAGPVITADYSTSYGPLQPGQTAALRFRAVINPALAIGTRITNTGVVYWDDPKRTASASVSIDVGGIVGIGMLSGTVWHDANFDKIADGAERLLDGWSVELYRNDRLVHATATDANGAYRISSIAPNYLNGDRYELRFVAPGAGSNTAKLGMAHSTFTNDLQRVADIVIQSGGNYIDVNLPIEPNGVVYNTITRTPIEGAVVTMLNAGSQTALPASCFYDPVQQNQVTLAYGYYKFDLNFADPSCPSGGSYIVEVTPPTVGYIEGPSQIIPPTSDASTAPLSVPACPASADDAILATAQHCEVQISEFAPPVSVRARALGTRYHKHFTFDDSFVPGTAQIFNNHIPLDPDLQGVLQLSKVTPMLNVTRGQLVPYTITFSNVTEVPLFDVAIVDRFPAGFRYVEGSARIDGVPTEPALVGRELTWRDLFVDGNARHSIVLLLAVGAGVSEGEFTNRAQAVHQLTNNALSNEGSATVRVIPDATFDCTDVTGKVFDDANRNGIQDASERGLSGVRVVSARGLTATTDRFGRFHITCAVVPREGRGSNFILKLDDRTLPSGYRASTDQIRVQRATRGKALRFNFGASIHRVVGLDIAEAVFEPGTTDMRTQWKPRLNLLMEELQKGPAVLRLSYLADLEDARLVEKRMDAMKKEIMRSWKALAGQDPECRERRSAGATNRCYELTIEPEVFWRRGAPSKQAAVQPASR